MTRLNVLKKALLMIALLFCNLIIARAQGYSLKIKLIDSKSKEGVPFATVSVAKSGTDKVEKYGQTDANGVATLTGIKGGKYTVQGMLLGYEDFTEEVTIDKNTDLGEKKMKIQVNFLDGETVTDVGNPIVVKKDTIEHNVAIMKTSDNDMLEDLLKRLPGIEVSDDGSVTANGKTITKVFIDGKSFFLDDPQLATKNLPAKIVNKVRVVEKKSEQAEFTGIEDGDEETVLDLNIKKGMMNGWMGNVTGGAGKDIKGVDADGNKIQNDFRYQGGGMLAKFSTSDQLVFIGNANNTNNRGFRDITGNMMGGMRGGRRRGGNNGIATSYMLGVNGGIITDNKSEFNGNYLFNANQREELEKTDKTVYQKDSDDLHNTESSENIQNTYGHRLGGRIDWKINKKTSIFFSPQFNYGWGNFREAADYGTESIGTEHNTKINDGNSVSSGKNLSKGANGFILLRHKIGEKMGRTISLNVRYSISDSDIDGLNQSVTNVYSEDGDTKEVVDQHYLQNSKSWSLGGRLSYTEPLGKNFFTELTYGYTYQNSHSSKDTKDKNINGDYTIENIEYSNSIDNRYTNQRAGFSIRKQEKKYNATIGAQYMPSRTINDTYSNGITTHYDRPIANWAPNARIDFNFSDYNMLRIRYRGNTNQPTINQLQPVPDNSNPQHITLGNPDLTPSFSHNMSAEYRLTNMETFASLNVNANFTYNTNNIVNASWYNNGGIQYTIPLNNSKGSTNSNVFVMINSPIGKSHFSIMSFTNGNLSTGTSMEGKSTIDPDNEASRINEDNYIFNDYQSLSVNENLRLVYRDDIFDISAGAGTHYSQAWYSVTSKNVNPSWNNNVNCRIIAKFPKMFDISTNARYNFYKGYTEGYGDPTLVWNAEISKQIIHNNATIAVRMYDILNQSRSTMRTMTDNYVLDQVNNTLGRYFIISFSYRFGKFGEKGNQLPMGMGPGGRGGNGGHGGMMGGGMMGGGHR